MIDNFLTWSRSGREMSPVVTWIGLIVCLVFAVALRLTAWHYEPTLSRDGINYVQVAQEIQKQRIGTEPGKVFIPAMATSHYLYSACLSLTPASLPVQTFGVWINILLGSLISFILGCAAWVLWGRGDLAVGCAALFAVFPKFVEWSGEIQREIPYVFFVSCFFLFTVLYCRKKSWYWSVAIGITMALSFICRYEGVELLLVWTALLLTLMWQCPGHRWQIAWHGVLVFIVFIAVIFSVLHLIGFSPIDFWQAAWQKFAGFFFRIWR